MNAVVRVNTADVISRIDDRLYGSFIEHMGRAVYTGIYEPGHPSADGRGFRGDVQALIRPLGLSQIRYPGGNFLSGYRWEDGVGPPAERPVCCDLAWSALEPNRVGTDEFLAWCEELGAAPMLGVNLGTGTPRDAVNLLEYCNGTHETKYAQMRRKNGRAAPYGVRLWCLGNEMDGPWQIGAKTAGEYGRVACETAKMMKMLDPEIELVACGSSFRAMPTFGAWERAVLRRCYPYIDYLSLHQYYTNEDGDLPSFLARGVEMDAFIREVAAICREIRDELGQRRDIRLSFDEWNVWYHFRKAGREPPKWTVARPIEEELYDFADALVVGTMLNTLINNADSVKIACLAQLVNTIAPIMTEPGGGAWVQTTYYPFLYASRYGRGSALRAGVSCPTYDCGAGAEIPLLDAAAVLSPEGDALTLFLVNRSLDRPLSCVVSLTGSALRGDPSWLAMDGYAPGAVNTAQDAPVRPRPRRGAETAGPRDVSLRLAPVSWNMLRLPLCPAP